LALLGASGWAAPPRTDRVTASIGMARTAESVDRTCTGQDGQYVELHQTHQGPINSTDPRLTGTLTTNSFFILNQTTGLGTGEGTFKITDPRTGGLKVNASFQGVIDNGRFKGFVYGNIQGSSSTKLFANISLVFSPDGGSIGDMGAPAPLVPADLAVIQMGSCSSGFGP
jgi:hypothetical protein